MSGVYYRGHFWPRYDSLESAISRISEDAYCAGWMDGVECALYAIVFEGAERQYGMAPIHQEQIDELRRLAEADGVWVKWTDDHRWPVVVPLSMCPDGLR